jgi:hypothetical protein
VSRNEEIQDPNLADLPPEAFEEIEGQPTLDQLETRIRAKREQAEQDAGIMQSPHHADDIEPIEPPAVEEPTEEPVEEEVDDDQADEAEEPEAEEEQPEEAHLEEDDGEEFFVGRYRTKEDVEAGIREKDATIARLFRERIDREQGPGEQPQQPDQDGPVLDRAAWSEWAQTAVEEGQGVQGALAALETGGQQGYDIYVAHWLESDDPSERAQAIAFNNEVTRQYAAQNARQAVQPEIERVRSTPPDDPQAVRQAFAAKHPDFEQLEPEMDRLILEDGALDVETKQWLADLAEQGGAGKQRALEYLYMTAAATRAPVRAKVAKEERQRRKVSADEAKLAATVSSAEGSSTRTPLPEAELAVVRRRNAIREKAGMPLLPEE